MDEIKNVIEINNLLDIYGNFLTDLQKDIMNDYYEDNLSLSEISENRNISRASVSDTLKKGREKLLSCEEKLHLIEIFTELKKTKSKEVVEQIESRIKNGI